MIANAKKSICAFLAVSFVVIFLATTAPKVMDNLNVTLKIIYPPATLIWIGGKIADEIFNK